MLNNKTAGRNVAAVTTALLLISTGCNSILNGWLTPIELGSFTRERTNEIRGSLSIQDPERGIRAATEPTPADLVPTYEEYRLVPGDIVNVFIYELRGPGDESGQQATVDNRGRINLPVVGWLDARGYTARELENEIRRILEEREILFEAEVLVQFAARRGMTYTIFGNENLALRLNRGPGVFPIPRADFRILDAVSVSGGLSELVRDLYVFRNVDRDRAQEEAILELSAQRDREPTPEVDDWIPPAVEEEPVVPPPPLPGAFGSNRNINQPTSFDFSSFSFSGSGTIQVSDQPASTGKGAEPKPGDKKDKAGPKDKDGDVPPDVQDLIDLMLPDDNTEKPTAEKKPEQTPPTDAAPAMQTADSTSTVTPDGAPTKWIFLNGEWVEVKADNGAAVGTTSQPAVDPTVDPMGDDLAPAIDWDLLASDAMEVRVIRIPARSLRQGDSTYNIVVRAGDVIRLYSGDIGFYYMTGHVRGPGIFRFQGGTQVTLKNAIAASGGLDALAWPDRVAIYRRIGDREQIIQVNLDRIYAGLDPDFYLKRDDIVNVGTHPFAPFLIQIRNFTIPQMGGTVSYFYQFIRTETFFRNENLDPPRTTGLFP